MTYAHLISVIWLPIKIFWFDSISASKVTIKYSFLSLVRSTKCSPDRVLNRRLSGPNQNGWNVPRASHGASTAKSTSKSPRLVTLKGFIKLTLIDIDLSCWLITAIRHLQLRKGPNVAYIPYYISLHQFIISN